jgi:hypothetical protein
VINGEAKPMAVTSAIGMRASAEKLVNMPVALIRPRSNWPNGDLVAMASQISPRQA